MPTELPRLREGDWRHTGELIQRLARDVNQPAPQARVTNGSNISHATSGTRQFLTFANERFDSADLHSTSSNTGRLTAPITGLYLIGGHIIFASNATGRREASIRLNGTTFLEINNQPAVNGDDTEMSVTTLYQFTAGDYVELGANQTSGGALDVRSLANISPEFWMVRLAGFVNQGV